MNINFKVSTPYGEKFKSEIKSLNIKTTDGYITVLPEHFPLITTVVPSVIKIKDSNGKQIIASTANGILKVCENETTLIVSAFELSDEIDVERAKEALKRAQERLSQDTPEIDRNRAEIALLRAMARIKASTYH